MSTGATVTVTDMIITDNTARFGGGIENLGGELTISNSEFSNNEASADGGGIDNFNGELTVTDSTFSINIAEFGGGIHNNSNLPVTVTGSEFIENEAGADGGGISNLNGELTVADSTFSANTAEFGGGIANSDDLTVTTSTFSANTATDSGGGIQNSGELTVADSTFSANTATDGGGIANSGELTVTASTFSANTATSDGGGIYNVNNVLTVNNSTFNGNTATNNGNGIHNIGGTATIINATLHNDTDSENIVNEASTDPPATATLNIGNTVVDAIVEIQPSVVNDLGGNFIGGDPELGPLQDNGGPTFTMLPDPDSPLIDAGVDAVATNAGLTTDQRGFARISGQGVDIGAVEIQAFIICYSGNSKIRVRNKATKQISDVCAKDVYSDTYEVYDVQKKAFVPIKYNIVTGPTNRYMLIVKDAFALDQPNEDFYITSGHKIVINGVPMKARHIPQAKRIKVSAEKVYSICTQRATTIMINGLEVTTWGINKWLDHSKKKKLDWTDNKPKKIMAEIGC